MGRKSGAGEGNRTLVVSLEGFCSTIELHPRGPSPVSTVRQCNFWSPDVTGGEGWIRTTVGASRSYLQPPPFNHSATPPRTTRFSPLAAHSPPQQPHSRHLLSP